MYSGVYKFRMFLLFCFWSFQSVLGANGTDECGHGWHFFQGYCYYKANVLIPHTWIQSAEACWVGSTSTLVSINSPEEQEFVQSIAPGKRWIGLRDMSPYANLHQWSWSDGSAITNFTSFWAEGHPWDHGCECVSTRSSDFKWECQPCDILLSKFVCKHAAGQTSIAPENITTFIPAAFNTSTTIPVRNTTTMLPNTTSPSNTTAAPNNQGEDDVHSDIALIVLFVILGVIIVATITIYHKFFRQDTETSYVLFAPGKRRDSYEMRHSKGPKKYKSIQSTSTGYVPPEVATFTESGNYLNPQSFREEGEAIDPRKEDILSEEEYLKSISVPRQTHLSVNTNM